MKYITLASFLSFCLYSISSLVMLGIFARVYLWITPYDEFKQIKAGTLAPAIALGGSMIGYVLPLVSISYHGINFIDFIIWSVVAGWFQLAVFKFLYWILPMEFGSDTEVSQVSNHNSAMAIIYASSAICVGMINAFSLIPQ